MPIIAFTILTYICKAQNIDRRITLLLLIYVLLVDKKNSTKNDNKEMDGNGKFKISGNWLTPNSIQPLPINNPVTNSRNGAELKPKIPRDDKEIDQPHGKYLL